MAFRSSTFSLAAGLVLLFAASTAGQVCRIRKIQFRPPDPKPNQQLNVFVLLPQDQQGKELTIALTTFTDRNNNGSYDPEEKQRFAAITKKATANEVLVPIFTVPSIHIPRRYLVIVSCGEVKMSHAIEVDGGGHTPDVCGQSIGRPCVPVGLAEDLRNAALKIKRRGSDPSYMGQRSIYTYTLADKRFEPLISSTDALYQSPNLSADGNKLTFVINQSGIKKLAWTDLGSRKTVTVTEGSDISRPLWMPDSRRILFLSGNRLYLADASTEIVRPLDKELHVTSLWGIASEAKAAYIFFEGPDPEDAKSIGVFRLELDTEYKTKTVQQLFDDPRFSLWGLASPTGDRVIYTQSVTEADSSNNKTSRSFLMMRPVAAQTGQRLVNDEFDYYEPAWSPDGTKIVLVTNRL